MHLDDDELALVALGDADADTRQHVEECSQCAAAVADLERVVDAGRLGSLSKPPEQVWERIAAAMQVTDPVDEVALAADRGPEATGSAQRRRRWWPMAVGAAAAAALLFAVVLRLVLPAPETVVASASLEELPGWSAHGTAEVVESDGQRDLRVQLDAPPLSGYAEVWLLSTDQQRLVSLGVLTGGQGSFAIPDGLDLADYAIVDVSDEQADGDPSHSGQSIVRGTLDV